MDPIRVRYLWEQRRQKIFRQPSYRRLGLTGAAGLVAGSAAALVFANTSSSTKPNPDVRRQQSQQDGASPVTEKSEVTFSKQFSAKKLHDHLMKLTKVNSRGKKVETLHVLKSVMECEEQIKAEESTTHLARPGNPIIRWDSNVIRAKEQPEDRLACDVISGEALRELQSRSDEEGHGELIWTAWERLRCSSKETEDIKPSSEMSSAQGPGEAGGDGIAVFSVFDGHLSPNGYMLADLGKKTLHPTILSMMTELRPSSATRQGMSDVRKGRIVEQMQNACKDWNSDILHAPSSLLEEPMSVLPSTPRILRASPATDRLDSLRNAKASAVTALVDAESQTLMVANLGDCRAVAGWYDSATDEWRCDTLTQDMTMENPAEAERVSSEHPGEDCIAKNGPQDRLFGVLKHSRGLGYGECNRSPEENKKLSSLFGDAPPRHPISDRIKTPPYVSSTPEVTLRNLEKGQTSTERLSFLILGSAGLFDCISSEEAVQLVATHMKPSEIQAGIAQSQARSSIISATNLNSIVKVNPSEERPWPAQPLPGSIERVNDRLSSWVLKQDDNAATHLARNALFGANPDMFGMMLSTGKRMRDDTSVIVIAFNTSQSASTHDSPAT